MKQAPIIGITGTLGSGKGTIVDYLIRTHGFMHYSVRDFLKRRLERDGLEPNRDQLTVLANTLRLQHGPSYITDTLLDQALEAGKPAIIESIRAVGEIESLRRRDPHFLLLAVDAPIALRYQRIVVRHSETDCIDFDTFRANEQREMSTNDPHKQNLSACIALADYTLCNDLGIAELETQIEKILQHTKKPSRL